MRKRQSENEIHRLLPRANDEVIRRSRKTSSFFRSEPARISQASRLLEKSGDVILRLLRSDLVNLSLQFM